LVCLDAATGEIQWRSRQPGDGFPTLVGKDLVIITKPGGLHVAKASPEGYAAVTELDLFDEHSWSQVAYADGHLFARSMGHLARIDVTSEGTSHEAGRSWLPRTGFGAFLAQLESASNKAAVVDAFLEKQKSFPIVEAPDVVHFVYRGEGEDVGIAGDMIGSRREEPMTRVEGTDLFYYSTRLEADAAVTYGFIVDFGEAMADPRNPLPGEGLFGEVSLLSMPARDVVVFDGEPDSSRQGLLETVEQDSQVREGKKLAAEVYLPAGYQRDSQRRYPTLYIYGGGEALEEGDMKNALDHLIGEKIDPLIAVFIKTEDGATYDSDSYNKMVVTELIPLVDGRYRTLADARYRGVMGSGSGGATALFGSFQHPDIFGRVGSQSPEWWVSSETPLEESMLSPDASSLSIYLDWGTYGFRSPHEAWNMSADTRELWTKLRANGYRPAGGELPEGYGWSCWRGHTASVLTALFPLQRQAS
jgi:enterochelin esterase-like enzyme